MDGGVDPTEGTVFSNGAVASISGECPLSGSDGESAETSPQPAGLGGHDQGAISPGSPQSVEKKRARKWLETGLVWLLIAFVWMVLILPIVFYHIRRAEHSESTSSYTNEMCVSLTDSTCAMELNTLSQCLLPDRHDTASLTVSPQNDNPAATVDLLESLLSLSDIAASDECRSAAISFTCLLLLPLCNGSNLLLPSYEDCVYVTEGVCRDALEKAAEKYASLLNQLPDCETLPQSGSISTEEPPNCETLPQSGSTSTDESPDCETLPQSGSTSIEKCRDSFTSEPPSTKNVTCAEEFAEINGSSCEARCNSWEQSPHEVTVAVTMIELLASFLGFVSGVVVIVTSIYRWRHMFSFPAVFIVYMTISYCIVALFVLITFFGQDALYCGRLNVIDATSNPTPFCTTAGIVLQYFLLNITLWWFFHVCSIFWKVQLPFHSQRNKPNEKYVHLVLVAVGVLIPVPGVIATAATDGYTINRFPPLLCGTVNPDAQYYSTWMPINLLLAVGIAMIILMFWNVHKHQGIFRVKTKSNNRLQISPAEKKLLFVFVYYTIFASIVLVYFGLSMGDQDRFIEAVTSYFACERRGHDSMNPCPRDYEALTHPALAASTYFLMGLIPAVNLIYVVHVGKLKQGVRKACAVTVNFLPGLCFSGDSNSCSNSTENTI